MSGWPTTNHNRLQVPKRSSNLPGSRADHSQAWSSVTMVPFGRGPIEMSDSRTFGWLWFRHSLRWRKYVFFAVRQLPALQSGGLVTFEIWVIPAKDKALQSRRKAKNVSWNAFTLRFEEVDKSVNYARNALVNQRIRFR